MILVLDMNCKKNSLGFYEFVLPIVSIIQEINEYIVKHYTEVTQDDLNNSDCVILSGTPLKDNVTLNQLDKFEWAKTSKKPILGICAGMQTLGLVFGLRLKICLGVGMTEIRTLAENSLFSSTFDAYALHNYSVEPSNDFNVLAESTRCVEAIKHKHRSVYGVLFHPEVRNKEILQRFIDTFSEYRRV
ncbi:MAG TPA: gamma-glutamyl-gamma-aminobutyrate hydrolase family protein [Candidatus Sulfotelmatobacter sp.]|nr:gamma-glutamyl-gamma-aminobutyrate hydrolase family protein [Candidatus Sulfotelmatobacter sp.]